MHVATTRLDTFLKSIATKPACAQKIDDINMHVHMRHETLP